MKRLLAAAALTMLAAAASAAAPKPLSIDCPAQPATKRMATKFVWDGTEFKQARDDGRNFVRKVEAAQESRRKVEQGEQQILSFRLAATSAETTPERRDHVALEIVRDENKQIVATFFKMATLESGFLTETLMQHWADCKVTGAA
jgi:hypothetical protein